MSILFSITTFFIIAAVILFTLLSQFVQGTLQRINNLETTVQSVQVQVDGLRVSKFSSGIELHPAVFSEDDVEDDDNDDYSNTLTKSEPNNNNAENTPQSLAQEASRIRLNKLRKAELLELVGPDWTGGKTKSELIDGILSQRKI